MELAFVENYYQIRLGILRAHPWGVPPKKRKKTHKKEVIFKFFS